MDSKILEESKAAIFLTGLYRKSWLFFLNSVKNSQIADLSLDIKRSFFNKAVKSASIFLFTAVSTNILLSAALHREMDLFDIIVKSAILFLSLGGYFCDANWNNVKQSSVILNKILRGRHSP